MLNFLRTLLLVLMIYCSPWVWAVQVQKLQVVALENKTRVFFELSDTCSYKVLRLNKPDRVAIDISKGVWKASTAELNLQNTPIQKVRQALRENGSLRVVFDLTAEVLSQVSLFKSDKGYRLQLDLQTMQTTSALTKPAPAPTAQPSLVSPVTSNEPAAVAPAKSTDTHPSTSATEVDKSALLSQSASLNKSPAVNSAELFNPGGKLRNLVIAIDPGHGGDDPGAMGQRGTQEKQVVLEIARALQARIRKQPGMTAVLTRDGDYFVDLARRRYIARQQHNADLFVSIHADAWTDPSARGASVFVLSRSGASSTLAGYLAKTENASDQFAGFKVASDDKVLRGVLADLAMEGSLEHSFRLGESMLTYLRPLTSLHNSRVEQAGFMVLKSLDVPSVLVETGFISNPNEERKLKQKDHQQQLANALFLAIHRYFQNYPLPGTYLASINSRKSKSLALEAAEPASSIRVSR